MHFVEEMYCCIQTAEATDFGGGSGQLSATLLLFSLLKLFTMLELPSWLSADSSPSPSNSWCCSGLLSFEISLWLSKLHGPFLQREGSQGTSWQGACAKRWIPRWVRHGELSCTLPLLVTSSLTFLMGTCSVNDFDFLTFLLIKTALTIDSGRTDSCAPARELHICNLLLWQKLRV